MSNWHFGLMDYISDLTASSSTLKTGIAILVSIISIITMFGLFGKNHMPVEGRTALITGASEGMGRSVAAQLAAKGANVIIVSRNVGRLEEALIEIKAAAKSPSQRFTYISADVSEPDYGARVIAEAIAWNGGSAPDIVWCVAGMSTPMLWTADASLTALRRNMDVNFYGSAEMSHAILREWLSPETPAPGPRSEPKHMIFTASIAALFPVAGYGPYTPSKWALRGLADTLNQELGLYPDRPVKMHVVYPTTILSPGYERENATKPAVTLQIEADDEAQTPEKVAQLSINGLENGHYFVTTSLLGELFRLGVLGASQRNSWVKDTLGALIMPVVWAVARITVGSHVSGYAKKHGHPGLNGGKA